MEFSTHRTVATSTSTSRFVGVLIDLKSTNLYDTRWTGQYWRRLTRRSYFYFLMVVGGQVIDVSI